MFLWMSGRESWTAAQKSWIWTDLQNSGFSALRWWLYRSEGSHDFCGVCWDVNILASFCQAFDYDKGINYYTVELTIFGFKSFKNLGGFPMRIQVLGVDEYATLEEIKKVENTQKLDWKDSLYFCLLVNDDFLVTLPIKLKIYEWQ